MTTRLEFTTNGVGARKHGLVLIQQLKKQMQVMPVVTCAVLLLKESWEYSRKSLISVE